MSAPVHHGGMRNLERVLAGSIGAVALLLTATICGFVVARPDGLEMFLEMEAVSRTETVFLGTGLVTLFLIGASLVGASTRSISPATVLFVVAASAFWVLAIEPGLLLAIGARYGAWDWCGDLLVALVLGSPLIVHYLRSRGEQTGRSVDTDTGEASKEAPGSS